MTLDKGDRKDILQGLNGLVMLWFYIEYFFFLDIMPCAL